MPANDDPADRPAARHGPSRLRPWRVDKTMLAGDRGTIKLARRHGAALVCVRYRLSPDGRERVTTVELVVERAPVQRRIEPMEALHLYRTDHALVQRLRAHGAQYDATTRTWFVRRSVVHRLGLFERIAMDHEPTTREQIPPDGT